jgi:hypothetical protein
VSVSSPASPDGEVAGEHVSGRQYRVSKRDRLMCDRLGIDVWEVIDAAKTKPFGFMPFYQAWSRRPLHTN